jgi:hypothetical protein
MIGIVIFQIYRHQEDLERKDKLIGEIEQFQNQVRFLKENPEMRYQLQDEDIFEIVTNYERFSQFRV